MTPSFPRNGVSGHAGAVQTPGPAFAGPGVADVLRHHIGSGGSVLVQDIPDTCLTTSRTDVSRHRRQPIEPRPCRQSRRRGRRRRPAWSSPPSPSRTAPSPRSSADYGVSRSWVYELLARYRDEGETAFKPRSRRPHRPHRSATAPETVELILEIRKDLIDRGLDAGPDTIGWHLTHHHGITVSRATIARTLTRSGAVTADPSKRPKSSYLRFEAAMPNETWQSDFTHYRLTAPTAAPAPTPRSSAGSTTTPATHSTSPHTDRSPPRPSSRPSGKPLTCTDTPHPRSPTTAWSTPSDSPATAEPAARTPSKLSSGDSTSSRRTPDPHHPTTCGKVERFQQTMKKWLRAQPDQPTTLTELQATPRHASSAEYNHHRPHRSLPHRATPATAYAARPKATPTGDRSTDTHDRTRHDIVSSGRQRHPAGSPANYATSASVEPTPEPASSCSSRTSTSASSTPPPANSSASSSSIPARTTSPRSTPK